MHPLMAVQMPARVMAGVPFRNTQVTPPRPQMGQVGLVERAERANLISITTGIAMAGGGVYSLLNVPKATKVSKIALGTLGGALLLTGLLKIYDAVD